MHSSLPRRALLALCVGLLGLGAPGPTIPIDRQALFLGVAYHPPVYSIQLNTASPGTDVTSLIRAGIVEVISSRRTDCYGTLLQLRITRKGQKISAEHGWDLSDGILTAPVGYLQVISTAAMVQTGVSQNLLAIRVKFVGNANAMYLKRLMGGGVHIDSLPTLDLTLRDMGRSFVADVPVVHDNGGPWIPIPGWSRRTLRCSN